MNSMEQALRGYRSWPSPSADNAAAIALAKALEQNERRGQPGFEVSAASELDPAVEKDSYAVDNR
jgi:hypothetical protein